MKFLYYIFANMLMKKTILYTILGFLPLSFALLFTPVYLNYLNPKQYGLLSLFNIYTGVFAVIYAFGISSAYGYLYWDYYKKPNELKKLISTIFIALLLIHSITILIGIFSGNYILKNWLGVSQEFEFFPYVLLLFVYPVFAVFYELMLYTFRNAEDTVKYSIFSLTTIILLTTGSVLGVVVFQMEAKGAVWGKTIGYGIAVGIFMLYFIKKNGLLFDKKIFLLVLKTGIPVYISTLVGALVYSMDRLMIERFFSIEALGIYSLAVVAVSTLEVWFNALNNAMSPGIFKLIKDNLSENRKEIVKHTDTIIFLVLLATVLFIAVLPIAFKFIATPQYGGSLNFIYILVIAQMSRVFITIKSYLFFWSNKTKYMPYIQVFNFINIVFWSYLLSSIIGVYGIAYGLLVSKLFEMALIHFFANRIIYFDFEFFKWYTIVVVIIAGIFLRYLIGLETQSYIQHFIPLSFFSIAMYLKRNVFIDLLKVFSKRITFFDK